MAGKGPSSFQLSSIWHGVSEYPGFYYHSQFVISLQYQKTQLSLIRGCSWTPPIKKYRSKSSDRKHCKAKHRVIIKEDYWDEAGLGWQCVKVRIAWEQKYLIQRREANVAIQQQPTVFSEVFSQHFFFVFTFAVLIRTRLRSSQKTHLYFPLLLFRSTNVSPPQTHTPHTHHTQPLM